MTTEEIKHGKIKNIEFKKKIPDKSNKYTKTVIAFANKYLYVSPSPSNKKDRFAVFFV